jgi:hypothetical protein
MVNSKIKLIYKTKTGELLKINYWALRLSPINNGRWSSVGMDTFGLAIVERLGKIAHVCLILMGAMGQLSLKTGKKAKLWPWFTKIWFGSWLAFAQRYS